jgi:uncharacterized protein YggE
MTRLFTIALVIASFGAVASADTDPLISVTASGVAFFAPEYATVDVTVALESKSASAATMATAAKHEAVVEALSSLGVSRGDVLTTQFGVGPVFDYDEKRRPKGLRGFSATHTVQVRIHDLQRVGEIVDAVVAAGAYQVSSLQFFSEHGDSVHKVALAEATRSARSRAEAIADALGGELGDLVELSTEGATHVRLDDQLADVSSSEVRGSELSTGLKKIQVTVVGRWRFRSGKAPSN